MPFSDDEQIQIEKKDRRISIVLMISIGVYFVSLFNVSFCTGNGCRTSIEVLLAGWIMMLTGGAAITWLANPLLIIAWILIGKRRKGAWIFALSALVVSASFLMFQQVIDNEAGHYGQVVKVGAGYWIWLASSFITLAGALIIKTQKRKKA